MIYLCIPLGSYLMCFRFLQVAWRFRRSGHLPHEGHAPGLEYEGEPDLPAPEPAR
jgi:C4-dicarboxylate transporter, DctQ subunit